MLSPQELVEKYGKFKGVLHVGAHRASEKSSYLEAGFEKRLWVEANPELFKYLAANVAGPDDFVVNAVIDEFDDNEVNLYIANNDGLSTSILPFKKATELYKHLAYIGHYQSVKTTSLKTILEKCPSENLDYIHLDIQGVELRALRGLGERLEQFRAVSTEINLVEIYEGCDMMNDMDEFLLSKGFEKIGYTEYEKDGWGDALYVRKT